MNFIDLVNAYEFTSATPLSFVLGESESGEIVLADMKKTTHIFVGGRSGSGKTNFLYSLITSLLLKNNSADLKIFAVDGNENNEFRVFDGIKQVENIYNFDNFIFMLENVNNEIQLRSSIFSKSGFYAIEHYNKCEDVKSGKEEKLPYIVVVLDDIVWYLRKDNMVANKLSSLIKRARVYGIYFIVSAQTADYLSNDMITNLSGRICFRTAIEIDSYPILNESGAEKLEYKGECLCRYIGDYDMKKIKCPLVTESTIKELLKVKYE